MMRSLLDENNMKINELNKSNLPIVRMEKELEQYSEKVMFQEKLDKANEILKAVGIPKPKKLVKVSGKSPKHSPLRQNRV